MRSRERRRDQHRGEEIKGDERIGERKGVRGHVSSQEKD